MVSLTRQKLKDIKSLRTKKGRRQLRLFLAEGVRLMEEALRFRVRPELLIWSPTAVSERGRKAVERFASEGIDTVEASARQMAGLSPAETSAGILAVVAQESSRLSELRLAPGRKVLLCEGVGDPGNLGTLMRCAVAFGFDHLLLCGHSVDPYSPKVVRASVGALFGLQVAMATSQEALAAIEATRGLLVAASLDGDRIPAKPRLDGRRPLVLALGSEADGLSDDLLARAHRRWRLSHSNLVESLNVSVAGALIMSRLYDAEVK